MSVKLCIAAFVLMLSGCSTHSNLAAQASEASSNGNLINIGEGVTLQLTAPDSSLVNQSKNQLLTITYKGKENQLLTQLELTAQGINLVAISPQGVPLFELVFKEGQELQQKQYVAVDMLPLPYIVSDIQLVYWPLAQLNTAISGAKVVEEQNGKERMITANGNVLIRIDKGSKSISYQHLQRGYQLTITPVE